ncbi:helix-turn-helix domain-containing protein [Paracoccus nototheniae]|uniref:Helix-turn-helix domain-containing protein n=1 Tax=Paracoccus nototheniae TaxID=2489002 RepID=A0ABW4DZV3_9RHOB|nr:helix-turn-helix domain-containing protein [Paracoccus nototheniae]
MKHHLQPKALTAENIEIGNETTNFATCTEQSSEGQKLTMLVPANRQARRTVPGNTLATDWAHAVPILRSTQRMLLLVLARHSDRYGVSWCSQKTLAAESGCCDRTVRHLLKEFEVRGLVRRVGRLSSQGAQITDVVIIVGWPDRTLIPHTGHPNPRITLKETRETRFQSAVNRARARTQFPGGPEVAPYQNKDNLNTTTTAQLDETLASCFDALGPWATAENRQYLSDDLQTLQSWRDKGIDLQLHILPVLAEKAKIHGKIPLLRTWRYFEVLIGRAVNTRQPNAKSEPIEAKRIPVKAADRENACQKADAQLPINTPAQVQSSAPQPEIPYPARGKEQSELAKALAALAANRKLRVREGEV